jgi:hypothetical protein
VPNTEELRGRIDGALEIAVRYGGSDGEHHKAWVIDQMVRHLAGCPVVKQTAVDAHGNEYEYDALGKSEEYVKLVADARAGEDGPETYDWDEGIAP